MAALGEQGRAARRRPGGRPRSRGHRGPAEGREVGRPRAARRAPATTARADRVLRAGLERPRPAAARRRRTRPVRGDHVDQRHLAAGDRAGLVEHDGVDPPRRLQHLGPADQDAELGTAAGADHEGGRRGQAERTRAGDDQDRDGGGERGRTPRPSAPSQKPRVPTASAITIGTKTPEIRSASRWTGALPFWASSTSRAIWASWVSAPTRVARTTTSGHRRSRSRRRPRSPGPPRPGTGSPVSIEASTADVPLSTMPSVAIFSPGRTTNVSPTTRSDGRHRAPRASRAARRPPWRPAPSATGGRPRPGAWRASRTSARRAGTWSRRRPPPGRCCRARPSARAVRSNGWVIPGVPAVPQEQGDERPAERRQHAQRRRACPWWSCRDAGWPRRRGGTASAPQTTTGAARVSDAHCQYSNCNAGTIAIATTGSGQQRATRPAAAGAVELGIGAVGRTGLVRLAVELGAVRPRRTRPPRRSTAGRGAHRFGVADHGLLGRVVDARGRRRRAC